MRHLPVCSAVLLALAALPTLALPLAPAASTCAFEVKPGGTPKQQALAHEVARTNPCTTVPGLSVKSLSSVFALMLSTPKTGGKRFVTPPPEGLPGGRMMAGARGVEFKLQLFAPEVVTSLQVMSAGKRVFAATNPPGSALYIPAHLLQAGQSYEWIATTRQDNFKTSFELLDGQESAAVNASLKALEDPALAPQVRQLYAAAIFDQAELYLDRDQVLHQLRQQVAP